MTYGDTEHQESTLSQNNPVLPANVRSEESLEEDSAINSSTTNLSVEQNVFDTEVVQDSQFPKETDIHGKSPTNSEQATDTDESCPVSPELAVHFENLNIKLDGMLQLFNDRLLYDTHKDTIIDRQYRELETFRNGLLEKLVKPLIMDIITEIDDIEKLGKYYQCQQAQQETEKNYDELEKNFEKLLKLYLAFASNLCDILEKHDVISWRTEQGSQFDPKIHTALKNCPTDDRLLHHTIRTSMRYGFKLKDKIIRREMVEVFVYKESENP